MSFIQKGVKAAELLVSVHFVMKGVNFFLGILIARIMDPEVYGTGQIQLSLTTSAILHLSREAFRKVALKSQNSPFGVMWLSVLLTSSMAALTCLMNPEISTVIISAAAIIEVLSEPYHISHLISINVKSTITAESLSTIVNALVVISCAKFGVIAFSLGQISSSITHFLAHYLQSSSVKFNLDISETDKSVLKTYIYIGIFKFFLSEGEKIFLTYMAYTSMDQGVFALVSNLCGIVPRLLYAPIEQITYIVFTKSLTPTEQKSGFTNIISIMWVFGLFSATYLQIYSDLIIEILYGSGWKDTQASLALSLYGFYLMIMGVFGSADAIDWGLSNKEQIKKKQFSSTCSFLVFLTSAFSLSGYGAPGLILSCILSMSARLCFATKSNRSHFSWMHRSDMLPDIRTVSTFLISYSLLRISKEFCSKWELLTLGIITIAVHLYVLSKMHLAKLFSLKSYKEE